MYKVWGNQGINLLELLSTSHMEHPSRIQPRNGELPAPSTTSCPVGLQCEDHWQEEKAINRKASF